MAQSVEERGTAFITCRTPFPRFYHTFRRDYRQACRLAPNTPSSLSFFSKSPSLCSCAISLSTSLYFSPSRHRHDTYAISGNSGSTTDTHRTYGFRRCRLTWVQLDGGQMSIVVARVCPWWGPWLNVANRRSPATVDGGSNS